MLRVTRFILGHPFAVLGAMIVMIGLGVWQHGRLEEIQSLQALIVRGDSRREVLERMRRDFGDDEVLAIAVDVEADGTVYRPEVLKRIDRVSRWLAGLDGVGGVTSITTAKRLDMTSVLGVPTGVASRPLYVPDGGEAQVERMRAYVRGHPLYRQRLVSADERTALVLVRFAGRESERINTATRQIQDRLPEYAGDGIRLWLAGYPLVRSELIRSAREDMGRLLFVALAAIVVILSVAFRRPVPVVLALAVIVAGVTVATGAIAALGIRMNNLLSMVPALVLIIASSTSMHLLTRYGVERGRGADRRSATARALIHVGPGCFWASATTAIGFLGLMVSRVPALRQCGGCSAMGVGLSFVLAMGLIPTLLTLGRRGAAAWTPTAADLEPAPIYSPVTEGIGRFVERFARPILIVALLVAGTCAYGVTRLNVETNRLDYFRPTDPLRVAYERIEGQFGGLTEIDVLVSGGRDGGLTPAAVRHIETLETSLGRLDAIDGSLSLSGLLKHVNQVFAGPYALPPDAVGLGGLLELTAVHGGEWSSAFVSKDRLTTRIILFTKQKGSAHLERLIGQIRRVVDDHAAEGSTAEVTGSAVVFAGMARYVVAGQVHGLMIVMAILFLIMSLLTRRVAAGLVCLLPTIVPILMLYGIMVVTGVPLNIHTSIVSALAAGIAIDNAIHLLNAFKRAYRRTGDYPGSVRQAIHVIGRPLIVNCLLIAGGLAAFTQGTLLAVVQVGVLLGLTMVNALVMGLLLLPALMLVLRPRIR